MIITKAIFLSGLLTLLGCGNNSRTEPNKLKSEGTKQVSFVVSQSHNLPYDFQRPSATYVLHPKLAEISGMSFNHSENTFLVNNDEKGIIYTLNNKNFKISNELKFSSPGDYEAIEKVGDNVIITKSNGTLYFYNLSSEKTSSYKNELKAYNNVEGLCYDENEKALLLACKGQPLNVKKGEKNKKCIYAFHLSSKKLNPDPYLTITDEPLISYVERINPGASKAKLKKLKHRAKGFAPSGIAIQPESGDFYISSAKGSSIVIFGADKQFKAIVFLNNKTIPQPEGLSFDNDGHLYLSTEGQGFSGKIFKFEHL